MPRAMSAALWSWGFEERAGDFVGGAIPDDEESAASPSFIASSTSLRRAGCVSSLSASRMLVIPRPRPARAASSRSRRCRSCISRSIDQSWLQNNQFFIMFAKTWKCRVDSTLASTASRTALCRVSTRRCFCCASTSADRTFSSRRARDSSSSGLGFSGLGFRPATPFMVGPQPVLSWCLRSNDWIFAAWSP